MSDTSIALRAVAAADGPALADLRVAAMRDSLEAVGRFDPERARGRFLDTFAPEFTREIVEGGARVGVLVVRPEGDRLLLDHLYVDPRAQGRGIGAQVLRQVFAEADAAGKALRVGALAQSRSNDFYRRHGFRFDAATEWDNHYVRPPGGGPDPAEAPR